MITSFVADVGVVWAAGSLLQRDNKIEGGTRKTETSTASGERKTENKESRRLES